MAEEGLAKEVVEAALARHAHWYKPDGRPIIIYMGNREAGAQMRAREAAGARLDTAVRALLKLREYGPGLGEILEHPPMGFDRAKPGAERTVVVQTGNCSNCGVPYANHSECGEFG